MRLTLYVKGVKKVVGEEDRSAWGYIVQRMGGGPYTGGRSAAREYPALKVYKEVVYKSFLPEDQKAILEMVGEMSRIHKFDLTVIDVTKENFLRRLWLQRAKRLRAFPNLVSDSGHRIEGHITEEQIKTLISK